jgi:hypothetical protein
MIAGALILIALLLVCGPLSGRLGSGGSSVDEAPAVAAGPPPADHTGTLGAAAVGALAAAGVAGAAVKAADKVDDSDMDAASLMAPVAIVAVVAGGTADGIGGGNGLATSAVEAPIGKVEFAAPVAADLPAVGAAGPGISDVMEMAASTGVAAALTTAGFDRAMVASAQSNNGVSAAGKVVARFAPPVASPPQASLQVASTLNVGNLIKPCDRPGSGCNNLAATSVSPPSTGGNPPIIPGRLPPVPSDAP